MVIFYSYVTVYQRVYQIMYNNNFNHLTYGDDHDENSRRIPRKTKPTSSCLDFRSCVQIQGSWILMINGCWWDRNAISCIFPALLSPKKTLFICIAPFGFQTTYAPMARKSPITFVRWWLKSKQSRQLGGTTNWWLTPGTEASWTNLPQDGHPPFFVRPEKATQSPKIPLKSWQWQWNDGEKSKQRTLW
jgi:hypothetical protein